MTGEVNHLQAYWRPRTESTRDCAVRFVQMLEGLAKAHWAFRKWKKKAHSRAAANNPAWAMPPDIDELTAVFEKGRQYKDVPRVPWPEMGYRVSAWNGRDPPHGASLSVRPGGYGDFPAFPNTIDLGLNRAEADNADLICTTVLKPSLLSVATAWEPDYAVVVPWSYWLHAFGDNAYPKLRSGWMTYLAPKYASRIVQPPAAITEPIPGGGLLLTATEDRFDMDNATHIAAAASIQAALGPLQEMVPPGRYEHLHEQLRRDRKAKGQPG